MYKINREEFAYEIIGAKWLEQLGAAPNAIVLTAHMGNYDLGAALFAQKFNREIRMVRAPEPDRADRGTSQRFARKNGRRRGEG